MKKKTDNTEDAGPAEKFADEIIAVCLRWYEESDLDEEEMLGYGKIALEAFCGETVEFESDIDLDEEAQE